MIKNTKQSSLESQITCLYMQRSKQRSSGLLLKQLRLLLIKILTKPNFQWIARRPHGTYAKYFDDLDDCYWAWAHIFGQICNRHAPLREIKVRRQSLPWVTPQMRHLMNLPSKTLLNANLSDNEELWERYRSLRNRVMHDVGVAKCYC